MRYGRLIEKAKDGGHESPVDAYFLIELKGLFSIALLKFNKGGREAYHTHAFNALTWFIHGNLIEQTYDHRVYKYKHSLIPKYTPRRINHRVVALTDSWCITVRGRWNSTWTEHNKGIKTTFTHGRKPIEIWSPNE
jgi:hypothetical protein